MTDNTKGGMPDYKTMKTDLLLKVFDGLVLESVAAIFHASIILNELALRRVAHPAMREGVLRWYSEIANGKLYAETAMTFGGVGSVMRKLIGSPWDFQKSMCKGGTVPVAVHDSKGEIVMEDRMLLQLTARQLDMVFEEGGGIRLPAEQKRILAARKPDVRRSKSAIKVRADKATGEVVCGQMRFKPRELASALKKLGFKLERIKAQTK